MQVLCARTPSTLGPKPQNSKPRLYGAAALPRSVPGGRCSVLVPRRDRRRRRDTVPVQALVSRDREPITPFIAKIRALAARGVSTLLVIGGCGDFFDVADTVIAADSFQYKVRALGPGRRP